MSAGGPGGGGSPRSPGSTSPGGSGSSSSPRPRGGGGPIRSEGLRSTVRSIRNKSRYQVAGLTVAAFFGLFLVWLHWFGLVAGGALVGFLSPTFRRALVAGFGFGVLVLAVFFLSLGGAAGLALEATPVIYVTVAGALVLPLFGSLARGLDGDE